MWKFTIREHMSAQKCMKHSIEILLRVAKNKRRDKQMGYCYGSLFMWTGKRNGYVFLRQITKTFIKSQHSDSGKFQLP